MIAYFAGSLAKPLPESKDLIMDVTDRSILSEWQVARTHRTEDEESVLERPHLDLLPLVVGVLIAQVEQLLCRTCVTPTDNT